MFESLGWFLIGAFVGFVAGYFVPKFVKRNNPDLPL